MTAYAAGWHRPFSSGLRALGAIDAIIADPEILRQPARVELS